MFGGGGLFGGGSAFAMNESSSKIKVVLISVGVFLLLAGLLFALLFFGSLGVSSDCKAAGFEAGAEGLLSATKCGIKDDYAFDQVSILIGNTANVPAPNLTSKTTAYVTNSVAKGADFSVFSATPEHKKISQFYADDEPDLIDPVVLDDFLAAANNQIDSIKESLATQPTENGAQYFEGITRAGRSLLSNLDEDADDTEKALLIVIGSGLSDGGLLNYASGDLLHHDPQEIVDKLVDEGKIQSRSLKGLTVVWSGLGATIAPQTNLTSQEIDTLQETYRLILREMGAKVIIDNSVDWTEGLDTQYTVQTTPTEEKGLQWSGSFDENSSLGFNSNADTFRDGDSAAQSALQAVIDSTLANPNTSITITGYVARVSCGDSDPDNDLAAARANKVKSLFVAAGVADSRITATSGGFGPNDECADSDTPNSEAQASNRLVTIKIQ